MKKILIILIFICTFLVIFGGCSRDDFIEQQFEIGEKDFQSDLDGNGVLDSVSLLNDGDYLVLTVNNSTKYIPWQSEGYDINDPHPFYEEPKVRIWNQKDSKLKLILVTLIWNSNKIGTKMGLWSFVYDHNEIIEVWSPGNTVNQEIEYSLSNYNNGTIDITFSELGISRRISIHSDYYDNYLISNLHGYIDVLANTMFYINDYDNDGFPEVTIKKAITTGAISWLPFSSIYEVYKIDTGGPILLKAFTDENIDSVKNDI